MSFADLRFATDPRIAFDPRFATDLCFAAVVKAGITSTITITGE